MVQVGLKVKTLDVALLDAAFLLGLKVHLVIVLHAGVSATGHHRGQVLKDDSRLQVLNKIALVRLSGVHFPYFQFI